MNRYLLAFLGLFLATPATAQPRQLLVCDTAAQLEEVFTLQADGADGEEVVAAVNTAAGSNACGMIIAETSIIEDVKHITLKGDSFAIIKIAIHAIYTGEGFRPVLNLQQFALMPLKKATAA